jgi:NitT/TauT family transport system substrate-binding protein
VRKKGFGDVDKDRLRKIIATITDAYQLPRKPALEEVFAPDYLPPVKDRMIN